MSIAVVMTTLYSPVIESILFGFLELAIHHNCMTVYGCMFCCLKSHMYVIYIVRAFTLILVISCHFMFFKRMNGKKTNAKREKYLQNAERQANERRKKICARKIATFTMTLTDAQKSLERARKQNECVQYFFLSSFSCVCVFFLFCSAALMLCSGDWCFIYTVCSMVVSNGFITCSYQCMYPFAICVQCTPRHL